VKKKKKNDLQRSSTLPSSGIEPRDGEFWVMTVAGHVDLCNLITGTYYQWLTLSDNHFVSGNLGIFFNPPKKYRRGVLILKLRLRQMPAL
jgi:hypothetical protein